MNTTGYFKLGLFILIGFGVLVAGAISLGAGRMFQKSIEIETCFDESISGLEIGPQVKHRGVTIGHVQSIRFPGELSDAANTTGEPFRYIVVEMAIDPHITADVTLPQFKQVLNRMVSDGLRARISQSGITGSAYVELNYLDPKRYPIARPPIRSQDLYVPSAPGELNQVMDAVTDIATKLQKADLDQIARHVDAFILHVDQSVQDMQIAELRAKAGTILDRVQSASGRLQEILDDPKLAAVISDLPAISGRVRSATTRVDELIKNGQFDQSAASLRRTLAEADELLSAQSENVRTILTDLRATVANARELTEDLKTNPSQLLFSQPPPRTAYGNSK